MSNLLSGMAANVESDVVEETKDSIGGGGSFVLDSGVYAFRVKYAFLQKSKKGAAGLNLFLETIEGQEIRHTFWMTSGDNKGNKNFYIKKGKDGKEIKHYLPGFNNANALALLTVGEEIIALSDRVEVKNIELYDFDEGKAVPTDVDMVMPLLGKEFYAGVIKEIVDKRALNDDTGDYEPTGETREQNDIDKIFRAKDKLTKVEILAEATEPAFMAKWVEAWKGEVKDRTSKDTPKAGAPASNRESGAQAPKKSLFS